MSRLQDHEITDLPGGLYGDDTAQVLISSSLFIVLCTLLVGLRFYVAFSYNRHRGLEDWIIIPGLVFTVALCAVCICSVIYGGGGRHQAYLKEYEIGKLQEWPKFLLASQILYALSVTIVKMSVLVFYLRIFNIQRWVRWTTHFLIAFIMLWGVIGVFLCIFQCKPVEYMWNLKVKGTCINQRAYYKWYAVPTFIHDVAMLLVPLPPTFKLQISLRRKIALAVVFLIGSVGCVASGLRMYYFFSFDRTFDVTWDGSHLLPWTIAEPGVILICACLPSLWPMIRNIPCCGALAGETVHSSSRSGKAVSKQDPSLQWSTHGRSHMRSQNDEFIPLNDFEDRVTSVANGGSSYSCKLEGVQTSDQHLERGNVISVTKEYSVA